MDVGESWKSKVLECNYDVSARGHRYKYVVARHLGHAICVKNLQILMVERAAAV